MYFVYVLRSKRDNSFYIGLTNDLNRRIKQHNRGNNFSTRYKTPLELIHFEKLNSRKDARNREKYLKSGWGRQFLKKKYKNNQARMVELADTQG